MDKASILAFVNEQLARSETDVETAILTVIRELDRYELLEFTVPSSPTISGGDTSLPKPTGYKSMISLQFTGNNTVSDPLLPAPGGYKGIEEFRANTDGDSGTGPPIYYASYGSNIEFFPAADKDYTYSLKHYRRDPGDIDNIVYGTEWENVLNFGATYYTAMKRSMTRQIAIWLPVYIAEKDAQILATPRQIRVAGG